LDGECKHQARQDCASNIDGSLGRHAIASFIDA
jgi:hypothetical protein